MRRNSTRSKARNARIFAAICYTGIAVQVLSVAAGLFAALSNFPN